MARKASMLDIFQMSESREATKARGPRAKSGARAKAKPTSRPARTSRAAESVEFSKRHLLYGSSVIALLVALSFVLGLAFGGGEELSRPEPIVVRYFVKGTLPKLGWTDHQPVDIRAVARALEKRHRVDPKARQIRKTDSAYVIYLGPFTSRDHARSYIDQRGLDAFNAEGHFPFARLEIVESRR